MSITVFEKVFSNKFDNVLVADFMIDGGDAIKLFDNPNQPTYSFTNPKIIINKILLEDNKERVSSFTLVENDYNLTNTTWELFEKIDVENCSVVILNEKNLDDDCLDDWLESKIKCKDLFIVEDDGKIYISSGFGPGVYNLMVSKENYVIKAIKIEFIKEKI